MAIIPKIPICVVSLLVCGFIVGLLLHGSSDDRKASPAQLTRNRRTAQGAACGVDAPIVLMAGREARTLTSPDYPQQYPSDADCRWLLTTGPRENRTTLVLRIVTLQLEPDRECRLDSVRLYLGSSPASSPPLGGPLCGLIEDRLIRSNASTLLVVFRSDAAYEEAGFKIEYFAVDDVDEEAGEGGACGGVVSGSSGWLTSPGFPDHYPDGVDCWTLVSSGSEDQDVALTFESLDLEPDDNCTFDYVRVFQGNDTTGSPLGHLCRQSDTGARFQSPSLLVHFHSDESVNRKGFRARYRAVDARRPPIGNCMWEVDGPKGGTLASPGYPDSYPSLANCTVWIRAPGDSHRILVTVESLLLEVDSNCSSDFLQIRDAGAGNVWERFCGRLSEPRHLVSSSPELEFHFRSDHFIEFLGFKLRYEFFLSKSEQEGRGEEEEEESAPFRFLLRPESATLPSGSTHALHCATDHPNAKIRWLKENSFLAGEWPLTGLQLLDNDTLWIRNMGRHLAGTYSCVAVAPEGVVTARARLLLTDDEPPCRIEFRKSPSDSSPEEGSFALLECLSSTHGVVVRWSKDGLPLPDDDEGSHVTVLKNGYLFVDSVQPQDSGIYECSARDPETGCVGRVSARLQVRPGTRTEDVCGKPTVNATARHGKIVGGNDAQKGAHPWQVMLWESTKGSFCGATLLNEHWISTAAHCLKRRGILLSDVRILLGKHDRERTEESEVETRIADSAHAVVYHPDFDSRTYDNDLALVRMRHRIQFTDHVIPACLGDRRLSERLLEGGGASPTMGRVTGWGQLKEKGASPRYLQEIEVPVVDQDVCRASTTLTVTRNMFCAGYSQEVIGDACQGDSGGPFMVRNSDDGRWYMVGVVSWGEGCGKSGKYGFYTKVANHMAWIHGVIRS